MLELDLTGKTALITGATGQLGRVMAHTLADCGADIAVHYHANRLQADKLVAAARENAENDRKKIVAEANREAVSIAEAAMEKLLAKETSRAYDAFVNAAEGEEKHEHE